jgi:8-oxoguanine deaminase
MVGGRWVVRDGVIPGLDVPELIRRHSAAALQLQSGV